MSNSLRNRNNRARSLSPESNLVTESRNRHITRSINNINHTVDIEASTAKYSKESKIHGGMLEAIHSHLVNPTAFILWNVMAILCAVLRIRYYLYHNTGETKGKHQDQKHQIIIIGYWLLRCFLHFRQSQLILCKKEVFFAVTQRLKKSKLASILHPSWGWILVIVLRSLSFLLPFISLIVSLDITKDIKSSSFQFVFEKRAERLIFSIFPTSTQCSKSSHGHLLNDDKLKNILLGSIEMTLELSSHVCLGLSLDLLLISTLTIWIGVREMRKELQASKIKAATALFSSEVALDIEKDLKEFLKNHEALRSVAKDINKVVKNILPCLSFISVLLTSNLIHAWVQKDYMGIFHFLPHLAKIAGIGYLGLRMSEYKDDIVTWINTRGILQVIGVDTAILQFHKENFTPVGLGLGLSIFYIDVRFVANFIYYVILFSAYGGINLQK